MMDLGPAARIENILKDGCQLDDSCQVCLRSGQGKNSFSFRFLFL